MGNRAEAVGQDSPIVNVADVIVLITDGILFDMVARSNLAE